MNIILLTFDIEDWFQVENFKPFIPFSSWQNYELRVEKNVHLLLDLLDSINRSAGGLQDYETKNVPKGTFFVLGWIAERLPHLVQEIYDRGHEIASHGYNHRLCQEESIKDLKADLERSKKLLEDMVGAPVYGYRAPNFSISKEILKIIWDCGYLYDSSYNSYRLNKRYGNLELFNSHNGSIHKISDSFYEIPISNLKIGKRIFHWGGGGYFRLIPGNVFNLGVNFILKRSEAYIFYIHPWEFDPDQPKINGISSFLKFRHYYNLNNTLKKFQNFLNTFKNYNFLSCLEYLRFKYPESQNAEL